MVYTLNLLTRKETKKTHYIFCLLARLNKKIINRNRRGDGIEKRFSGVFYGKYLYEDLEKPKQIINTLELRLTAFKSYQNL